MSFVVPGSMGGSAQSFIKGKCCQDAGRLKAPRRRCDLCSRHEAINHHSLCFHRLLPPALAPPPLRLKRAQTPKCAQAINTRGCGGTQLTGSQSRRVERWSSRQSEPVAAFPLPVECRKTYVATKNRLWKHRNVRSQSNSDVQVSPLHGVRPSFL